jgi:acetoin utilization deacetylase AcuC-like enzyme
MGSEPKVRTLVTHDPRHLGHAPPKHSDSSERIVRILEDLTDLPPTTALENSAKMAELELLTRVHVPAYVMDVISRKGQWSSLDHETPLSPGSVDAALAAAGGAADLVDAIVDGRARNGFALTRPPGHHAEADRGMGFCILNNAAVAAARARERGLERVLIVDWDVHHGNGTQSLFYDRCDTMVFDLHQAGLFPTDSGGIEEAGVGAGLGYHVNVPLPAGCGDGDYLAVLRDLLPGLASRFRPDLVLVSAGFDAHARDPEGEMQLSEHGFAAMTAVLVEVAERYAGGRLGLLLEGGYDIEALGRCVRQCVEVLAGGTAPTLAAIPSEASSVAVAMAVRDNHRRLAPTLWA